MRKFLKNTLMCALILTSVVACKKDDDDAPSPSKVVLNPASLEMIVGDTKAIIATVEPADAEPTEAVITWTSSNDAVVTVTNGMVTAVTAGEAAITAKTVNGIEKVCPVTVKVKPIPAVGVTIENDETELEVGKTLELDFGIVPIDANTDTEITWESSDDDVATVSDGVVTAVAKGDATIKASIKNGASAKVKIVVKPSAYIIDPAMVGTWKCVKLQARYTKDGKIYEEGSMDKLFKIEGMTEEEFCKQIKDAVCFVSADNNTITWKVALKGGKTKDIIGNITRDDDVDNQFFANYHVADTGINFGPRADDYNHVKINWLPATTQAVYDEPGGSFYDFIYTCTITSGSTSKTVTSKISLEQLRSFKCVK